MAYAGGPSLGDIRSRLIRLAGIATFNRDPSSLLSQPHSRESLHALLSYRLPTDGPIRAIKQEWMDIVEGRHKLWDGIDAEKRECVRGFLVHFESDVLHRAHRNFNFRGGSIGNFLLVAMQRFFRSIQSAIFLFAALTGIPHGMPECHVLPAINTNKTTTIAAHLQNGTTIVGQCEISHPSRIPEERTARQGWSAASTRRVSPEPCEPPKSLGKMLLSSRLAMAPSYPPGSDTSSAHSMDDCSDDPMESNSHGDTMEMSMGNLLFSKYGTSASLESPIERTCSG